MFVRVSYANGHTPFNGWVTSFSNYRWITNSGYRWTTDQYAIL